MPNPAQYEHKLEAYTEGKDPRAMQADAPRILAELIEGVPELALRQRPLPDVTHDFSDAHEVVQEAFFKAYQKLHQFRETARFSTWLIRISLNESFIKVRKLRLARDLRVKDLELERESLPFGMTNWAPNTEELCSASELAQILRKCLDELNPYLRVVFVLRDIEELPVNETAEALKLTPIAVNARLLRARLHLRDKLSKYLAKHTEELESPDSGLTPGASTDSYNQFASP